MNTSEVRRARVAGDSRQWSRIVTLGLSILPLSGALVPKGMAEGGEYEWTIMAGNTMGAGFNDGPAAESRFMDITGMVYDAAGNLYVADAGNYVIRRVSAGGMVTTLAGAPKQRGMVQGTGAAARFSELKGLARDAAGNLYAADGYYIRRITPAGEVSIYAGTGQPGAADGPRLSSPVEPESMVVSSDGTLCFLQARFDPVLGYVRAFRYINYAGNVLTHGTNYSWSSSIAADGQGRVYAVVANGFSDLLWQAGGPGNGRVVSGLPAGTGPLAVNAAGDSFYAGATFYGGVYKMVVPVEGTFAWNQVGAISGTMQAMVLDPAGIPVAATANRIFRLNGVGSTALVAGSAVPAAGQQPVLTGPAAAVRFRPSGLAARPGGGFYTTANTSQARTAFELVPEAGAIQATDYTSISEPRGVATGPAGTVWLCTSGELRRYVGGVLTTWTANQFSGSSSLSGFVAADGAGNAWVNSGRRLFRVSAAGQISVAVEEVGGYPSGITALAADSEGNVYTGHDYYDAARIRKITPSGQVSIVASLNSRHNAVRGITVDADGTLFASDVGSHPTDSPARIVRVTADGVITPVGGAIGRFGIDPGDSNEVLFNGPGGIIRNADGSLCVADSGNYCFYRGVDVRTLAPQLTAPAAGGFFSGPLTVSYTLAETPQAGSVVLTFTGNVQRTLTLTGTHATAGRHTLTIDPAAPAAAPGVGSVTGGGTIPPGLYEVKVSFRDAQGNAPAEATAAGVVISSSPVWSFDLWRTLVLNDPTADAGADADGDGWSNFVEYALPGDPPVASDVHSGPDGSRLHFNVTRDPLRSDVTIVAEAGSDLASWTMIAQSIKGGPFSGPGYVSGENGGDGLKLVVIRDPEHGAKRFVRFRVISAP